MPNLDRVMALARRDIATIFRQKAVLVSMVIMPLLVTVALPIVVAWALRRFGDRFLNMAAVLDRVGGELVERHPQADSEALLAVAFLTRYFAPLFLLLPLMLATSTAADSFAGEKERKTLETLLHSPITNAELILGKVVAAALPALLVAGGAFGAYIVVANGLGEWLVGSWIMPTAEWWVLVLWTVPASTTLGLGMAVLVSARTSSVQAANQLAPIVVLPVVGLVYSQLAGAFELTPQVVALIGAVTWLVAIPLLAVGVRFFRRTEQISAV
ncbi:ABC transporter permease subunit [Actinomadura fulvescens]|uniref:ABC transporter permease n=1 Tax=Actinomadura fulvescens TaxID=46160 RepID=A0ABP6BRM1_9ACTN